MKLTLPLLCLALLLGSPMRSFTQQTFDNVSLRPGEHLKYSDLEAAYNQWAQNNGRAEAKGWKWYARWLHEQAVRAGGDGSLGDQLPLFRAAMEKTNAQAGRITTRGPGWIPVGPETYPSLGSSFIIRGMGRINCVTFHPTDPNTFWVGVAQGGIWKTTNGGQSWMPLSERLPILRISDIAVNPNNPDEMYASVGDYAYVAVGLDLDDRKRHTHYGMGVFKSADGGQSWAPTGLTFEQTTRDGSLTRRVIVHQEDGQRLVAAGIFGVETSNDGGQSWQPTFSSMVFDIERSPADPNTLYLSSAYLSNLGQGSAGIWKSTDFGQNWQPLNTGIPPNAVQRIELAISPSQPDYIYALACNIQRGFYGLYRSTNAGQSWQQRSDSPNVLHWYDGSGTGGQGTYDLTILVDPNDPDRIYTGGINLWASEDGGQSWKIASYWVGSPTGQSIHADQHYLAYNPLDGKIYACNDGGISRTDAIIPGDVDSLFNTNDYAFQTVWEDIAGGMQITSFYRLGLSQSTPGSLIAGSQDNSSWLKQNGSWASIIGGDGMEGLIHPTNPNIIYGSSQYGNIVGSYNGGQNFFSVSNNIPTGPGEQAAWTTPFMLEPGNPDVLYVAITNLYKSTNGGDTWSKISNFPGYQAPTSSFAVSPANPAYIYLAHRIYHSANEPGKMWRTTNGGQSWKNVTAGLPDSLFFTYVTADEQDPNLAWVAVGGFAEGVKVFRTYDGGDTWENISFDLPNIPVNCIVQDPTSAVNTIYAGTDIGVYVHNDNMAGWELFSDGLPNVIVSELEILPDEEKIYAATFGRGIWEGTTLDGIVKTRNTPAAGLTVKVGPNPSSGAFQLFVEGLPEAAGLQIEIIDITGRRVLSEKRTVFGGRFVQPYELPLPYGLYFVRVSSGDVRKAATFIIE